MSMAQWERAQKDKDQYLSSITGGSHVLQHSSFQLSTILHAAQNPFGSHDVLGELAEGARWVASAFGILVQLGIHTGRSTGAATMAFIKFFLCSCCALALLSNSYYLPHEDVSGSFLPKLSSSVPFTSYNISSHKHFLRIAASALLF
eukprot:1161512-Pelagomonas_calceolata.AAC.31